MNERLEGIIAYTDKYIAALNKPHDRIVIKKMVRDIKKANTDKVTFRKQFG